WVYEGLALALRESGGSPEEIQRAEISAAELEPLDAQGYLRAARALTGDKSYPMALAFCQEAARLQPNSPTAYHECLYAAAQAKHSKAMEWAAGRLLQQDWPVNGRELHGVAAQKVDSLVDQLEKAKRKDEARRLADRVGARRQRDLVVKLGWQGE